MTKWTIHKQTNLKGTSR